MDPKLIGEFMKNPEMMNMAMNMLKTNPGIIENIMKMHKPKEDNLSDKKYNLNQEVEIKGLINDEYNGKIGKIEDYHLEKNRYQVFVVNLEKSLYLKEENLVSKDEQ